MSNTTILIFDQDPLTLIHLKDRLQALGYRIQGAFDHLQDVLSQIKRELPQIILINAPLGVSQQTLKSAEDIRACGIPVILAVHRKDLMKLDGDGPWLSFDITAKPVIDGEIRAIIELALYRHRTEKTIRENQQQLQAILRGTGEGLITFNPQSKIGYMNMVAEMMTGWQQAEAFGKPLSEVLTIVDQGSRVPIAISDLIAKQAQTESLTNLNITLISRDNTQIPVQARVSPIRDSAGHMYGGVIYFGNISELKQTIHQARLQTYRSEALLGIMAKLNSQLDLDSVLHALLEETTAIMGIEGAIVVLLKDDGVTFQIVATHSVDDYLHPYKGQQFKLESRDHRQLQEGVNSVQVIYDIESLSQFPFYPWIIQEKIKSIAQANLEHENRFLGLLAILGTGEARKYSDDDLQFLKGLADQASLAITNARLFENVRDSRFRLQYLSKRLVEIQEAERRSMARELHDQIGQELTGLQFLLESGKRKTADNLDPIFNEAQEMVSNLIRQVRDLSLRLLPSMLEDMGLLPTLQWHFEQFTRQTGIRINFTHSGLDEQRFPQNIEITAYRIIQEGLTNAARHAQVDDVEVEIYVDDSTVHLKVKDQGIGFDPEKTVVAQQAFGLIGVRERVMLIGGKVNIHSSLGKGTQLVVLLPLGDHVERRRRDR